MMEVVIAPQREEDRKKFVNSFKENKKGYNIYKQTTGNRKFWALHENLSYSKENSQISVYFPELALNEDGEVLVVSMRLLNGGYVSSFTYEEKKWKEVKNGFTHFRDNDIIMAKITPCFQNLKSALLKGLKNKNGAGTTELHVLRSYGCLEEKYFSWFIKNQLFVNECVAKMTSTAGQQRVSSATIANYAVPLPPLAEQKRIVAKIEELLPYCQRLKEQEKGKNYFWR
jgi:type I restriction enzyme S subunit